MTDTNSIPKHQLLVKLLKMTTSNTDAEALVAIRKANQLLVDAGWDWDKLMAGKIVVVGDPFSGLKAPPVPEQTTYRAPPQAAKPQYPTAAQQAQRQQQRAKAHAAATAPASTKPTPQNPLGHMPNKFEGHCYCCGKLVAIGGGFLFTPSKWHNRAAAAAVRVSCTTCNTSGQVGPSAAPRQGPGARKVTADDLA